MNNSIRIAVCDDLKTERQKIILLLSSYLDQNNLYAEIDEFESGETFLSSDMTRYSLIFLDIFMGGLNGMETAKKIIQSNQKIQIVFASTSIDFAAEAFNIEALHYIVKPIGKEQVYSVLDKFFESFYSMRTVEVKVGRLEESIYLSDILYIEAKGKKTLIHMKTGILEARDFSHVRFTDLLSSFSAEIMACCISVCITVWFYSSADCQCVISAIPLFLWKFRNFFREKLHPRRNRCAGGVF